MMFYIVANFISLATIFLQKSSRDYSAVPRFRRKPHCAGCPGGPAALRAAMDCSLFKKPGRAVGLSLLSFFAEGGAVCHIFAVCLNEAHGEAKLIHRKICVPVAACDKMLQIVAQRPVFRNRRIVIDVLGVGHLRRLAKAFAQHRIGDERIGHKQLAQAVLFKNGRGQRVDLILQSEFQHRQIVHKGIFKITSLPYPSRHAARLPSSGRIICTSKKGSKYKTRAVPLPVISAWQLPCRVCFKKALSPSRRSKKALFSSKATADPDWLIEAGGWLAEAADSGTPAQAGRNSTPKSAAQRTDVFFTAHFLSIKEYVFIIACLPYARNRPACFASAGPFSPLSRPKRAGSARTVSETLSLLTITRGLFCVI